MRNYTAYIFGVGSFYTAYGIQVVLFPWIVAVYLNEAPEWVGVAQACLLAPTLLFLLFGGAVADRYGGRSVAMSAMAIATLPTMGLAAWFVTGQVNYTTILIYALTLGMAQAFISPARDSLINRVAVSGIQNAVALLTGIQFAVQILGFFIAGMADSIGPLPALFMQVAAYLTGYLSFWYIREPFGGHTNSKPLDDVDFMQQPSHSIRDGLAYIGQIPILRTLLSANFLVGVFLIGGSTVGLPLLVRDVYHGSSTELSLVYTCLTCGTLFITMIILAHGNLHRRGLYYILSLIIAGSAFLILSASVSYLGLLVVMFVWGCGAGIGITMSRTIVQEVAPEHLRGRIMAAYILGFMGGAPVGSLAMGFAISLTDTKTAMMLPGFGIFAIAFILFIFSPIRRH